MKSNSITVDLCGKEMDEDKEKRLKLLFSLVEAAYDEQTLEQHLTNDKVSITLNFPRNVTFNLRDAFALATSMRP